MYCNCSNVSVIAQIDLKSLKEASENNNDAGDATWILTSAFIIFTMQSGFGLLEAGSCSTKNECNIMVKNAVDVIFGALGYYICGFGFSFGSDPKYSNAFAGFGDFMPGGNDGHLYAQYFFQLSFATTATTIVSGAMAERTNLKAYMIFSFLNFLSYVFPAHWIWDDKGFLRALGVVDIAGCGPVHIVGGVSALVATILLQPRIGVFDKGHPKKYHMASPTNVVFGTFMLWWGWLGFNCGSTFGVSGGKWKLASKAAVLTVNGSVGGGIFSIFYSYYLTNQFKGKLNVGIFTTGIIAGLVSITSICAICTPWEALIIGFIGGIINAYGASLITYLKIDDPVNCIPVHFFCGVWGMVSVGLFGEKETDEDFSKFNGVFKGGSASFLGYQIAACLCIIAWAAVTTTIELFIADRLFGLRMSTSDEILGADIIEHGITSNYFNPETEVKNEKLRQRSIRHRGSSMKRPTIDKSKNNTQYYSEGMINFGFVSINDGRMSNFNNNNENNNNKTPSRSEQSLNIEQIEININSDIITEEDEEPELRAIRKTSRLEMFHLKRSNTLPS